MTALLRHETVRTIANINSEKGMLQKIDSSDDNGYYGRS